MTTHNFSIEDLAMSLVVRLDRKNIFPPLLNNPEIFLSPITDLSSRRTKRSPNAFLVCRKNVHEEATRKGTFNMRVISKVTGILWKHASVEEKSVYKKLADRVYEIHYRRTSSIYKKMNASSLKERVTYKLHYSFPMSGAVAPPPLSLTPVPSVPSVPAVSLPTSFNSTPTFNFDLKDKEYSLNDQTNNNNQIDLDFNNINNMNDLDNSNQIIPHPNQQQLIYFYNNIFI